MSEFRSYTVFEDEEFKIRMTARDTAGAAQDVSSDSATMTVRGPSAYAEPALLQFTSDASSGNGSSITLAADGTVTLVITDEDMGVIADGLSFSVSTGFRTARCFFQLDVDRTDGSSHTIVHGHLDVVQSIA